MSHTSEYGRNRGFYEDVSGSLSVTAVTGNTTLKTVRGAGYTIFLQRVHVQITGASAGKTWELTGGIQLTGPFATDTDGSHFDMDFGPGGLALTANADLLFVASATGASGSVVWEAYQKQTSPLAA